MNAQAKKTGTTRNERTNGTAAMNRKVQSGPEVPLFTGVAKISAPDGQTCIRHTISVAGLWDTKKKAMEVLYIEGSPNVRTALRYQGGKIKEKTEEYSVKKFTFNPFRPDSTLLPIVINLNADYKTDTFKKGHYSFRAVKLVNIGQDGYKAAPRVSTKEDVKKYIIDGEKLPLIRVKDTKTVDALNCFFGKKYNPFRAETFLIREPDAHGKMIAREVDNPVLAMAADLGSDDDEGEPIAITPAELEPVEKDGVVVDRRTIQEANLKLRAKGQQLVINARTKELEVREIKVPKLSDVESRKEETQEVRPNDPSMGEIGNRFGDALDAFMRHQA